MSKRSAVFAVCSVLMGLLLFAIWSNILVYGQQQSSSSPPLPATKISAQLKAKMCDPSNPSLKAVNTTESRICGIAKTIKNTTTTTEATPISSSTPQQTTIIKPTSVAGISTAPKQQQITNTIKNNTNASSRSTTNGVAGATLAPVSNPSNKSLTSTSPSSSAIAPQVKAVNEQQQPPAPSPVTLINGTDRQNDPIVATPPVVSSGKLLYLGYHDGDTSNPTNGDSGSKDKSGSDTKPSSVHSTSPTSNNDSIEKKKEKNSSSAKLDRADSTNDESSSSKDKGSSFDAKPSSPPYIKITAPDNDASSNKKKSSSTTLDRTDSASDDTNTKPSPYSTVGSNNDGSSISKKKNISTKVDITPNNDDNNSKGKKSSHSTELPSYDTRSSTTKDDSSTRKKKTTDIGKFDRTYSASDDGEGSKDKKNKDTTKLDTTPTINNDDSNPILKGSHHIRSGTSHNPDSDYTTDGTSTDSSSIDTNTPTADYSTGKSTANSYATTDNRGSIDNGNSDPNFSTSINGGSILSPSDLASSIKNKVESIIRNSMGGIIDKTPFLLPFH